MPGNLGDMVVTFSADISNLTSSVSQAQNQLADFATVTTDAADQITQLVSTANISDLTVQIDGATSSLSTLGTEVASTASSLQGMGPSANLSGFVSDIDVAQAQLVLLQSKAADAATALQEMQAAAVQSGDMSGLAEAQAQLVLLQGKAQDAAAALQELQVAESDTSGSSSFGDAISGMMGNLGNFGSSIGSGISSLLGMGGELGMAVMGFQMLGNMAQQTAGALLAPAATAETTQLSFTTLMHSASAAKDEMVALNTYAASTPMQTQWVDDAASKFLAFGFNVKSVIPDINAIGDSLSGLGKLSAASLNSIVDIFGKIQAQGKLTGGDMMQLSDAGIPAWKALSEAMGKPIPVLQQMVSKGLLPASTALPALQKGMENIFGGGMAKQAATFTGVLSTLSSDWQIAMAAIGGPLLKIAETGLTKLSTVLASPAFQQFATTIGVDIANIILNIGNFISKNVIPAFISFGTYLGSIAPQASSFFSTMWNGLQQVGNFLRQTFTPVWQQLVSTFNDQLVPAWQNFYNSVRPVMPELETAAKWIGEVLVVAIVALVQNLAGLMKDSIIVFGAIAQIIGGTMTVSAGYIALFVDFVTGQWGSMNTDMVTIGNGWTAAWAGIWNSIVGIFGKAINGLIDQVNSWLSGMVSAFNAVSSAIGGTTIHFSAIGHVSTMSVPTPVGQKAAALPPAAASQADPFKTNPANSSNPFTQFMNSLGQLTAPSSSSNSLPAAITSAASGTTAAVNETTAAVNSSSGKSAAAQQKAADSANARSLRLAADQKKALTDSSSSAVKALVAQSQAAAAKGDNTTAAFYAQQADALASQQKAAATKATNASKAAAKKAATAKASAAKKAATAKAVAARKATTAKAVAARAAAKKKTATVSTPKTSTRGTSTGTSTPLQGGTTTIATGTGTTIATGTSTPGTGATTGAVPQTLTIVLEINGKDFGAAVMPFVMTAAMTKVRLKTGLKV